MAERRKFTKHVTARLEALIKELFDEVPELDGIAVVMTYAEELGDPAPYYVVRPVRADINILGRMSLQANRLLKAHVDTMHNVAESGFYILKQLDKQIEEKRKQFDDTATETESTTTENSEYSGDSDVKGTDSTSTDN